MCDSFTYEYRINLRAKRVNNHIYRIVFIDIDSLLLPYLEFQFHFQYFGDASWQTLKSFDYRACRIWNETGGIFTFIRIPNKLFDFSINICLSLKILANAFGFESNIWMKPGDILSLQVPSSYFDCDAKVLSHPLVDDYVDFCTMDHKCADLYLLFRSDTTNNDLKNWYFDIYSALMFSGMDFASDHVDHYENYYDGQASIHAQSRCFAYHVMMMLCADTQIRTDYNLKISCSADCDAHLYTKYIDTMNKHFGKSVSCHMCRCTVSEYDFIFYCDKVDRSRHIFCVLCVYEMVERYQYFRQILDPLLLHNETLNIPCMDVLVSCIVGKVTKFEY